MSILNKLQELYIEEKVEEMVDEVKEICVNQVKGNGSESDMDYLVDTLTEVMTPKVEVESIDNEGLHLSYVPNEYLLELILTEYSKWLVYNSYWKKSCSVEGVVESFMEFKRGD